MTLAPSERGQGAKATIPKKLNQEPPEWRQVWRGVQRLDKRLLVPEPHRPLARPFLGPKPVFEIKPRGLGLRGEPVPPGGFGASPNAPGDVRPSRAFGVLSRGGWSSANKTGAEKMSRKDAHAYAASLAATLMVAVVVFQAGDGSFGAVPADEIDGDEVAIVGEIDPFQ